MKIKKNYLLENIYIFLLSLWTFLNVLTYGTYVNEMSSFFKALTIIENVIWFVFRVFIVIKILTQFNVEHKSDWVAIALLILQRISIFYSKSGWMSEIIWIVCGLKKTNLKRILRCLLFVNVLGVLIVILLSVSGVIGERVMYVDGIARHSLGFNHPNALGARFVCILLLYIAVKDKIHVYDAFIFLIVAFFLKKVADSRTAVSLICFSAICLILINISYKKNIISRISSWLLKNLKIIIVLIGILIVFIALNINEVLKILGGGTLWSRVYQGQLYFKEYGITLFGSDLKIENIEENFGKMNTLYTLDDSYLYLLIGFGIILFIIFIAAENVFLFRSAKEKKFVPLLIITVYLIYGIFETTLIRYTYNFSIVYLGFVLWNNYHKRLS